MGFVTGWRVAPPGGLRGVDDGAVVVFFWLGLALEVLGLGVAAVGIRATWLANAPEGETFAGPAVQRVQRWRTWASTHLIPQRWRRGRTAELGLASAVARGAAFGNVMFSGRAWGGLQPGLDTQDALAELDRRIMDVWNGYHEAVREVRNEIGAVEKRVAEVEGRTTELDGQLDRMGRDLRVEGLRGQAVGLGLLAVGLVLQSVGQLGM